MIAEAAALLLGAGIPLGMSQARTHKPLFDTRARDVAFWMALGAGGLSVVTGSRVLGALAIGSGGAWAAMKSDDLIRRLP